jgi:hypothetical protein
MPRFLLPPLHRRPVLAALTLWPALAGCYVYGPLGSAHRASGDRIRLTLTDSGTVSLASQLGPSTEEVSGRIVADSSGVYVISVLGTRRRGGVESDWEGERVAVPRLLVARAEQRRFSRPRSVLAGATFLVATLGARAAFWGSGGVFGGGAPGGGPTPR